MKNRFITFFIIGVALCLYGYYNFNSNEKRAQSILYNDSIRYERLNKKINALDSTSSVLRKKDSIQLSNYIKLKFRFEKTKKSFDVVRDSIGTLPDL